MEKKTTIILHTELISKKNHKMIIRLKTGRSMLINAPAGQKAHKELHNLLIDNSKEWNSMIEGKPFPYKVHMFIYRKTRRRFDYINIVQMLFDVMQEVGWIEDDDATHLIPVFEGFDIDKDNPRVELWVE